MMGFYRGAIQIDQIVNSEIINKENINSLQQLIVDPFLQNYFWKNLNQEQWFPILLKDGFFNILYQNEDKDYELFLTKNYLCDYLLKISAKHSKSILKLIKSSDTNNENIIWKFIEIGRKIDAQYTANLVPDVNKWLNRLNSESSLIGADIIEWLDYLVVGNQVKAALRLLKILTGPKVQKPSGKRDKNIEKIIGRERSKAIPKIDYYNFKELLVTKLDKLIEITNIEVAEILTSSLYKSISIESNNYRIKSDYSYIWRVAIEDHVSNTELYDIKEVLLVALRNCLEVLFAEDNNYGTVLLNKFLNHKYSVFKRLAIHLLRINFDFYKTIALELAQKYELLKSTELYHEYYLFLKDNFKKIPGNIQASIINSIFEINNADPEIKPEEQDKQQRFFRWERLNFFVDNLDPIKKKYFIELQNEFSNEKFRDTTSWIESYSGEKSPITISELTAKNDVDLWNYLKSYKGSGKRFNSPSIEGLARIFGEVFRIDPERFLKYNLSPLLVLKPNYSQIIISIIAEQMKTVKYSMFMQYINNILFLCSVLMRFENIPKRFTDDIGTNFTWVKKRILDIIQILIKDHRQDFPFDYKDKIWEIIEYLCYYEANPDDIPDTYKDGEAPYSLAINSVRSSALIVAIDYALWYAFHNIDKHKDQKYPNRYIGEERVLELFEDKLSNKKNDPSLAIHSIFGVYLPNLAYLNYQWVIDNIPRIFTEDNEKYWKAAWGGYISASRFYSDLYGILQNQYLSAIVYLSNGEKMMPAGYGRTPEEALSEHLIVACMNGLDDIYKINSLLRKFCTLPDNPSMVHAVQFIANLSKEQNVFDDNNEKRRWFWPQAKKYWELRIKTVKMYSNSLPKTESENKFDTEFSRYFKWLDNLPDKVSLSELQPLLEDTIEINKRGWCILNLLQYLNKKSFQEGTIAIKILNRLIETKVPPHIFYGTDKDIEIILENAIKIDSYEVYYMANAIVNKFGEWGNYYFKNFWLQYLQDKEIGL